MRITLVVASAILGSIGALDAASVHSHGRASAQSGDTVRARLLFTIGEGSPGRSHEFAEVSGIAVDREGRIYVSDFKDTVVLVFSADGRRMGTVGRQGRGPGEFTAPTGPAFGPDGALYVRNMESVIRFVTDPRTGLVGKYDSVIRGPTYLDWRSKKSSRVDGKGAFYMPDPIMRKDSGTFFRYLKFAPAKAGADTLRFPRPGRLPATTAWVQTSAGGGRMVKGLNEVPFAPVVVWEVTQRGTMLSGSGQSYLISELDEKGVEIRKFTRAVAPQPIDGGEKRDSARALKARIDSLPIPVRELQGATDAVKEQRLPATYPSYIGVVSAEDGRVWVRRWPAPGRNRESFFDVFEADGRFARTVVLPVALAPAPAPVIRGGEIVGMTVDPDTDLEAIVKLQFTLPGRR